MEHYYEQTTSYNGIRFQLTNKPKVDEREIHAYHEILYFMEGEAVLLLENRQERVERGSLILIPKEQYHFFRLRREKEFLRFKISIPAAVFCDLPVPNVMSSIRIISKPDEDVKFVLSKLCNGVSQGRENGAFYAYAACLQLLAELDRAECPQKVENYKGKDPMLSEIIRHISQDLSADLSINAIAGRMNVSASGITHAFKKEMGISVHEYIRQKRLIYARKLILSGQRPSELYLNCGYRDYSSFYKAYLGFYGYPPSKERGKMD